MDTTTTDRSGLIILATVLGVSALSIGLKLGGTAGIGFAFFIVVWTGVLIAISRSTDLGSSTKASVTPLATEVKAPPTSQAA